MAEAPRDLREAERRIDATGAVAQVMNAVWALARAQQPAAEASAAEAATYLDQAERIIERLAGPPPDVDDSDVLHVLVGPERPFCGPLARTLLEQLPPAGRVGLVGARLAEVAALDPAMAARVVFTVPAAAMADEIPLCTEPIAAAILAHARAGAVHLLHPDAGTPRLRVGRLLTGPRPPAPRPPELLSPQGDVLEVAVQEAVAGRLAVGLAEALRAEVAARLAATDAARRACQREVDDLTQQWRILRQESITMELIELSAARRP